MDVGMSMYLQNATESDRGKGATSRIKNGISWPWLWFPKMIEVFQKNGSAIEVPQFEF